MFTLSDVISLYEWKGRSRQFGEVPSQHGLCYGSRLRENQPNVLVDGTVLDIGYMSVSDGILIPHVGVGKSQEPVQFSTGSCRFALCHSFGRFLPA